MRENEMLGIIFSNMHDHTLGMLTEKRTTASVPFGGRYRFIDFTLSNMVNSGIGDVGIITKSNYQSLVDHIGSGKEWDLDRKRGGLSFLSPFNNVGSGIYRGRIEALSGAMNFIRHSNAKYVLLSDTDVIANMDYRAMLEEHVASRADVTLLYKNEANPGNYSREVTFLRMDDTGRVVEASRSDQPAADGKLFLDIILMEKRVLERYVSEITRQGGHSFTKDFLQPNLQKLNIRGLPVRGVSLKVCSLQAYFEANMELLNPLVRQELFWGNRPIYTKVRDEVPAKYGLCAKADNCLVADGAIIEGEIENSIIFRGVRVEKGAKVKNCILMQGTTVEENASLNCVITDKNVRIQNNRVLTGYNTYPVFIAKGSVV